MHRFPVETIRTQSDWTALLCPLVHFLLLAHYRSAAAMVLDLSDDQLLALCQQRGLTLLSSAGPPPTTQITPALSHFDSAAHPSSTSYGLDLQLHPPTSPSLSVPSVISTQEHVQASRTMAPLNADIPRRHPLHPSWSPTGLLSPSIPATPTLPLPSIPAHRQSQRRAGKRKHHKIHSGTEESGVENTHPQVSIGENTLLAQVERLHEACTALPVLDPHYFVGSLNGGKVQDFAMHLARRDALMAEMINTLLTITQELTELTGAPGNDTTSSMKYMDTGSGLVRKRKAQRMILEQHLTDSIKVCTV